MKNGKEHGTTDTIGDYLEATIGPTATFIANSE